MDTFTRPAAPPWARFLVVILVPALLFGGWMAADLGAQDPPKKAVKPEEEEEPVKPKAKKDKEEEEEPVVKPRHKVVRVEDEGTEPKKPTRVETPETTDLVTAARQAKNPVVRDFLDSVAEPHDVILLNGMRGSKRVEPVTKMLARDPSTNKPRFTGRIRFHLFLDTDWLRDKDWDASSSDLAGIKYYEEIVPEKVKDFLTQQLDRGGKTAVSRAEMLRVAEMALDAALRFTQSAREQGKREGFEELEQRLKDALLDVQIQQEQRLADANDWDAALALAKRLSEAYPRPEDHKRIAQPLAAMLQRTADAGNYTEEQLRDLDRRRKQMEGLFPDTTSGSAIDKTFRDRAVSLFKRAKDLAEDKPPKTEQALVLLRQAEDIYPRLPELRAYRLALENKRSLLRVGVRDLPVNMAPGLAASDSEKQAVELLFESLVRVSNDPQMGQRYTDGLVEGRPQLIPLGRQFQIARGAYWANDNPVTAGDVRFTVQQIRSNANWPGYSPAWADLVDTAQVGSDPSRVTLRLRQGFFDPLSLMTFKVLPEQPTPGNGLTAQNLLTFAQNPVGSGPYQFKGRVKEGNREAVSFVANSAYAARPSKADLPAIREIRFVRMDDPVKDFQAGLIEAIQDLPSDQLAALQQAVPRAQVVAPQSTRRIYFLAVNSRHQALQNQDLRRALAHAIDREKVLDDVYRANGTLKNFHKALNGPYPAGSWAADPLLVYKVDYAQKWMKDATAAGLGGTSLTLKFPDNDPRVARAMQQIHDQVQAAIGVNLALTPESPQKLREDVEVTHNYDLAYYSYDYPSDAYWLFPLFDDRAMGPNGTNYLGYSNDGPLLEQFGKVAAHRDFQLIQEGTRFLHKMLFDRMPLIPLWQLDRHVVLHPDLQTPAAIDPLLLFTDVEFWRLEKK